MRSLAPHAVAAIAAFLLARPARAETPYVPADQGQRPVSSTRILPEQFLRGFDPITAYFPDNQGHTAGPADDGAQRLKIAPSWPGAWTWADAKTLQFRPAEPWPALSRFAVEAAGTRRILSTLMSAPAAMSPASGADHLQPFRVITLTFPQALPIASLKQMITLEARELPGLGDGPRQLLKGWNLAELPRASQRDPAVYALTLDADLPEGKQLLVQVSLALGDQDKVLWTGRLSTRLPFHLESVQCGSAQFALAGGANVPKDMALPCGSTGEQPQLVFSAPLQGVGLTELKQLVRLEPSVPDLHAETYGARLALKGKFVPDTLYKLRIGKAELHDDTGRALRDPGEQEVYFYLGWKTAFLKWNQSTAVVESHGPRMLPLVGYGDARADVRVYRIDPLYAGLWPFPRSPVVVDEQSAPPFPGEEPATPGDPESSVDASTLQAHLRLLGSPLVSRLVELPLANKGSTTHFGLDLGPMLDEAVGKGQPGTYLVGIRRLSGPPQRSYVRVQVTNLAVTTVEEREHALVYVRTLDTAEPVRSASVVFEGIRSIPYPKKGEPSQVPDRRELKTDSEGRVELTRFDNWVELRRISVRSGDDALVLDPSEAPPVFANNHWGVGSGWLAWLAQKAPPPAPDPALAFLFTERPIYKPEESVFLKGYVRQRREGSLTSPGSDTNYGLKVEGPGGQSWDLKIEFTALAGFSAEFHEKDVPTGTFTASVYRRQPYEVLAKRSFQIEAYRVPTFEVRFSGPQTVRLDAPFKAKAIARYYAGGNVAAQPIAWSVTRRPYHYVPAGRDGFLFASSTQFARPESAAAPSAITRLGTLNDDGADEMSVNPALDVDGSARIYHFEATVTGADEQQVSAVEEIKALPPFVMGMKLARYAEKAVELKPEIIAVGVDDQLLSGQDIQVRLFKRTWHSHLRETNFSTGEAKYVTEQEDVKLSELTVRTADKPVVPTLPLKEAGVYVVELTARDKLGRVQTLSADLYVGGPQPVAWRKSRDGVFEVSADAKSYRPGETAKLIIQSPFQSGEALVVVEEPTGNTYRWVEVRGGKAVVPVHIDAKHVPNLPVHVLLVRGRLPSTGHDLDDGRYRPQTLGASIDLEVQPTPNTVAVSVKHPETARPGSKADFTITLTDDLKHPVGGEVTLWLVDEAVLSLAKEETLDPLSAMVVRNRRETTIRDTRNSVIGQLLEQEDEPGGDGDDAADSGSKTHVVRKNFKTVPFYAATLTVPPSGKLVVPITLSDDLTNFKVRAVAASGMARFGWFQDVIHVRLPVIVQPQLPRFVRMGDRFWAGGVARLVEGAEGPGVVDVNIKGPVQAASSKQEVALLMNKAASVVFPVTVNAGAITASELTVNVAVTRKSDGVGDAFEVKLPVLPDRVVEHAAFTSILPVGPFTAQALPEPARPGTAIGRLTATTVPGLLELASSLEYLGEYPHGCLEQQMSQLYPQVAQGVILAKLGLDNSAQAGNTVHIKKLIGDLGQYQDDQGLFSYWPGGKGDVQLTAQFVDFLQDVKKAGIAVDEKIESHALEALKRSLRSDSPWPNAEFRHNLQSEALRTLARYGQLDEHYAIELFHARANFDVTSLATLALAMDHQPVLFKDDLAVVTKELWDSVVFKLRNGVPVYQGMQWRRTSWGWGYYLGDNTASLATVLLALVHLDPSNPKLATLRDALIAEATPERAWGNTYDNRVAISSLTAYLEHATEPTLNATVTVGNQQLTIGGKTKVAQLALPADLALSGTVRDNPVRARVEYTFVPAAPGTDVKPLKQGFLVERSTTLIRADGAPEEHYADAAGTTHKVAPGDILELHTTVTTTERQGQVAVVVPFAAGFEPLNPELANAPAEAKPSQEDSLRAAYVQRLDHEVRYYFLELPAGTQSFHFRVRAATEGSFVQPAPYAERMYREDIRGRGEGMRIIVSGGHEK